MFVWVRRSLSVEIWPTGGQRDKACLTASTLHLSFCIKQCSKLPVAKSPLATNFSRWRSPTFDLVAKKKKKQKEKNEKHEQSRFFRKEGGQIGSEHSFFHSSASVWSRTTHRSRNSHLSRACEVLQCRSSCVAGALHTCGRKIEKQSQRDKTTPCHNTQLESRFTFLTLLHRERRRTDPERTFFLSVSVRSSARRQYGLRNSHLSRACEALQRCVFSHFSFHTCGGEKDTITARHDSFAKKAGRSTAWASFRTRLGFDRLRGTDREAPTCHVHAKVLQRTAPMFAGRSASGIRPRSSRECSANATQGLVSYMCKNIPPPPKKKKETRPALI